MPAGSNILLFDENKSNMLADLAYASSTQRTDGVLQGIASSQLQNKFQYQVSLVAYSIAQMMVANGKDANDADQVATFVANLSDSVLQKVIDKATQAQAEGRVDDTKWLTPLTGTYLVNSLKASLVDAETGTEDTKWMTAKDVKAAITKFAPEFSGSSAVWSAANPENLVFTNGTSGITATWSGETLVLA